ncbi:MAG: PilZ domain-containing protein [Novosphingobium sp.]|nr:PilZ domain-containing protein [Novosphingobium sp.]
MSREIISRKAPRRPLAMPAQCRTQSGLRDNGEISNISAEGCCIITRGIFVKEGLRVVIRPEGMEGLTGVVRWIEGHKAGIEFDAPLYGPVVDHLSRQYADGSQISVSTY